MIRAAASRPVPTVKTKILNGIELHYVVNVIFDGGASWILIVDH